MKLTMKLLALFFGALMLVNVAYAESPREQLKQMVEQLQKSPDDNALRESIIKLAQGLKPAPAVPDEAERRMARGMAAFKGAKSVSDYQDAVKEFEQATLAAPWYGDAYFNLGVAQDKAENYEAALRSLRLAQLASTDSKAIKPLIYEVEYRNEKAHSPPVVVAKQATSQVNSDEELIRSIDGAIFVRNWHQIRANQEGIIQYQIAGKSVILTNQFLRGKGVNGCERPHQTITAGQLCVEYPVPLNGRRFECDADDYCEISSDGKYIVYHDREETKTFPRQ